ncbi:MAG: hypothetical protein P1V97_35255, partial [Planctomycetota bacterium]|nr:hypothetical protein [Planctomycetota bacterium]
MRLKSRVGLFGVVFLILTSAALFQFLSPVSNTSNSASSVSDSKSARENEELTRNVIHLEASGTKQRTQSSKLKTARLNEREAETKTLKKAPGLRSSKKTTEKTERIASSEAAELLKQLILKRDRSALSKLKALLKNGTATVAAFRELLGSDGFDSSQKLDLLIGLAKAVRAFEKSDDPEAKEAVLAAQKLMKDVGYGLIQTALANPDENAQGLKALHLFKLITPSKEFIPWLKSSFDQSKDASYRSRAVHTIGQMALDEGSNALFEILLQDRDALYRDTVYQTLVRTMSDKTFAELQAIIDDEEQDQSTKVAAIDLVSSYMNVNARKNKLSRADIEEALSSRITELENALNNPALPRNVHREAISALGEIGGVRARNLLYGVLLSDSREFYVQASALNLNNSREGRDLLRTLLSNTQGSWQARLAAWEYLIGGGAGVQREAPNFTITDWTVDLLNEGLPLMTTTAFKQQLIRRIGSRKGRDLDLALSSIALSSDIQLKRETIVVLGVYHSQSSQAVKFIPDLKEILEKTDQEIGRTIRQQAAHALSSIGFVPVYKDGAGFMAAHAKPET